MPNSNYNNNVTTPSDYYDQQSQVNEYDNVLPLSASSSNSGDITNSNESGSPILDVVVSILPILASMLSVLGSMTIVYLVIEARRKKMNPYRRILFALSCCDIVSSIGYAMQSFLVPSAKFGNHNTCSVMGFVLQLSISSVIYNAMLSFYFLLSIRHGMKDHVIAKRYEPLFHIIPLGFSIVTAIIGLLQNKYIEVILRHICWIDCYKEMLLAWMFCAIPLTLSFVCIVVNNLLVYCHVRNTIRSGFKKTLRLQSFSTSDNKMNNDTQWGRNDKQNSNTITAASPPPAGTISDSQQLRIHAVATQSFLYVACFMITYIWLMIEGMTLTYHLGDATTTNKFQQQSNWFKQIWFSLVIFKAMFFPCQGFFNFFVYIRPTYLRCRKQFANETKYWSFKRAMFGDKVSTTASAPTGILTTSTSSTKAGKYNLSAEFSNGFRRLKSKMFHTECSDQDDNNEISTATKNQSNNKEHSSTQSKSQLDVQQPPSSFTTSAVSDIVSQEDHVL